MTDKYLRNVDLAAKQYIQRPKKYRKYAPNFIFLTKRYKSLDQHISFDDPILDCCKETISSIDKKIQISVALHLISAVSIKKYYRHCRTYYHLSNLYKVRSSDISKRVKILQFATKL